MDFVGPLTRTQRGGGTLPACHRGLSTTWKPSPFQVFFSQVDLPREILTDRGTPFTSQMMQKVCEVLEIRQLFTAVYNP